jgi:hypothetical protein
MLIGQVEVFVEEYDAPVKNHLGFGAFAFPRCTAETPPLAVRGETLPIE